MPLYAFWGENPVKQVTAENTVNPLGVTCKFRIFTDPKEKIECVLVNGTDYVWAGCRGGSIFIFNAKVK